MTILEVSAAQLGDKISRGELTSTEVTEFFIERIEKYNLDINAVIDTRFDKALTEAKLADEKRENGAIDGPLHGVPITIKDAFEVVGLTCDVGYPAFAGRVSQTDAVVVQRLKAAGAIIIGKTNTPLLCADLQSYNDLHGTTNNPYNTAHTPGGSSGGSAAALAAGFTPLEFGSDIGGSIRTPAHFCGLFGHKPTYGIIPARGHVPPVHGALTESALSVVGPLARSVDDIELAFNLTLGLEKPSATALQLTLPETRATKPKNLRVGLWPGDPYCPIDDEIAHGIARAAKTLEEQGATIVDARPDFTLAEHHEVYLMNLGPIIARGFSTVQVENLTNAVENAAPGDKSADIIQARGALLAHREWLVWHEMKARLGAKWAEFFENIDVLLAPATPTPAMPHLPDKPFNAREITVNGMQRPYSDNVVWAGLASLCELPATAVPLGKHSSGLPIGMQIIGPVYGDRTTMAAARMLEQAGFAFVRAEAYG